MVPPTAEMKGGNPHLPRDLIVKFPVVSNVNELVGRNPQELAYPPVKLRAFLYQAEVGGSGDNQIEVTCQSTLLYLYVDELTGGVGQDDKRVPLSELIEHLVDLWIDTHLRGVPFQQGLTTPWEIEISEPVCYIIPFQGPIPHLPILLQDQFPRLNKIHARFLGVKLGDALMPNHIGEGQIDQRAVQVERKELFCFFL